MLNLSSHKLHWSFIQGREDDVLTLKVNDMGHFGCYLDCVEKLVLPLQAEATLNLIRRPVMSSFAAHSKLHYHFLH